MKHCHFSILWNELPFLKQKMKFLYDNFHQIIFYDLNIKTMKYSDDGSHEFIKEYPDPQNKITLIEKRDLSNVNEYSGSSFVEKRKMFAVGSKYVRDDMDFFWCDDMDEFFNRSLMLEVEKILGNKKSGSVIVPHIIFFKNDKFVFCDKNGNDKINLGSYVRIMKHNKDKIYAHCDSGQAPPVIKLNDHYLYHYAYVGDKRVKLKADLYKKYTPHITKFYNNIWCNFDENKVGNEIYGHPNMHPGNPWGIKRHNYSHPKYINIEQMMKDLNG